MEKNSLYYRYLKKKNKLIQNLATKAKYQLVRYEWTSAARKRIKLIGGGYNGSWKEYRNKVVPYWHRFGIRPEKFWFDLYCDGMNAYDPRFIPDSIWFCRIIPKYNNKKKALAYSDKGMYHRLLQNVKQPETIVKKIAGYYYNGDKENIISLEEAINLCEREDHLIIKPSSGEKGGGIMFYDRESSDLMDLRTVLQRRKGFVVQKIIKQHPDLERLNSSSINTVRVISFHYKDAVYILSAILRIGGINARIDNVSTGGCACSIKPDGWLRDKAVNRQSQWTDETSSGLKFSDICVPNYEGIIETVKRLHCQLPYLNILGWDFAVGEDGTPVFIEFNTNPGQNQIGGKEPTFGVLTDEVLEDVFLGKKRKKL